MSDPDPGSTVASAGRRIRVAVIYGGRSSEHGVSAVSAGSVLAALDRDRYDVMTVGITRAGRWVLTDADPSRLQIEGRELPEVRSGDPVALPADPSIEATLVHARTGDVMRELGGVDVVFPVLHGRFGEDGTIQGLLEMAGVPYVGAGVLASAAAMDKEFSKKLLAAEGLPVGRWLVVRRGEPVPDVTSLGLPLFVKPARAGSSIGISRIDDESQLAAALTEAFAHDDKALIEAAVSGREVECGVLEDADGTVAASLPAEIRLTGGRTWYDFAAKYLDDASEFDLPAKLPDDVTEQVQAMAVRAFRALDGAGLARVDFFVTDDGDVVINEVNTLPGFTPISMYPAMWASTGVPYAELLDRLIATALRRAGRPVG
ncbi:MAG: D-alanine--D-alanine ligase family protein [bacterium]